tara:strand:- start:909 stop:1130 length:222 start_codon:yes stop_codon:yes gene_type:complete
MYLSTNKYTMLKPLFDGLLIVSDAYYGDAIGLAPIGLARPESSSKEENKSNDRNFWDKECSNYPSKIHCLDYD